MEGHGGQDHVDHGQIDILINNAAICLYEPILETTNEIYDRALDIDLKSIFLGMKEVLPHMIKRKQGSIINVSSIWDSRASRAPTPIRTQKAQSSTSAKTSPQLIGPTGSAAILYTSATSCPQ